MTKKTLLFFISAILFAAEPEPPKLTEAQRLELTTATAAALRAEVAIHRLKEEYERERQQRIEAAQKATQVYAEVVKRLAKLVPEGYELKENGEIVAKPKADAAPAK